MVEEEESSNKKDAADKEDEVPSRMKGILARFRVEEALQLPKEIRRALVEVLMTFDKDLELWTHECTKCCSTCAAINFIDKDLLLGLKPHN